MEEIKIPVTVKKGNKLIWGDDITMAFHADYYTIKRNFIQEYPKREDEDDEESPVMKWRTETIKDSYTMLRSAVRGVGVSTYICGTIAVEIIYEQFTSYIYFPTFSEAFKFKDILTNWMLHEGAKRQANPI